MTGAEDVDRLFGGSENPRRGLCVYVRYRASKGHRSPIIDHRSPVGAGQTQHSARVSSGANCQAEGDLDLTDSIQASRVTCELQHAITY